MYAFMTTPARFASSGDIALVTPQQQLALNIVLKCEANFPSLS